MDTKNCPTSVEDIEFYKEMVLYNILISLVRKRLRILVMQLMMLLLVTGIVSLEQKMADVGLKITRKSSIKW